MFVFFLSFSASLFFQKKKKNSITIFDDIINSYTIVNWRDGEYIHGPRYNKRVHRWQRQHARLRNIYCIALHFRSQLSLHLFHLPPVHQLALPSLNSSFALQTGYPFINTLISVTKYALVNEGAYLQYLLASNHASVFIHGCTNIDILGAFQDATITY